MTKRLLSCAAALAAATLPLAAEAYVGPGAGLSLLGALWALLIALGTAIAFVVAWPLRKMLRRRRAERAAAEQQQRREEEPRGAQPADSARRS